DQDGLAGFAPEAAVHLAGAGIGEHRWTEAHKRAILDSRVQGTTLLSRSLAALGPRPEVMVSASAIGFYGNRGDEVLTEDSGPGQGFLAGVVKEWEASTAPAAGAGIRVVMARSGIVLAAKGGALGRMLPLFRLCAGGPIGSGRQWWSWITLDDEVGCIIHALATPAVVGPMNATAPGAVTNKEFSRALGRAMKRPALLAAPRFGLSLVVGGEMADDMLLASQRVQPAKALATGYAFRHPGLDTALPVVVGKAR
ncbi:MAG: TIGR01777 family oxidoreductase, partial [Acidimicrobiales bacterium]